MSSLVMSIVEHNPANINLQQIFGEALLVFCKKKKIASGDS